MKLQAFLDGELPDAEARVVANWLAQDQEAVALLTELRQTRQGLAGFEAGVRLPESREFFWSKIEREIQRQEPVAPAVERRSALGAWLRFLIPAGAAAAVVVAALFVRTQLGVFGGASGPELETASADPGAFTYRDYSTGTTLVWLSYPAENDVAEGEPAAIVQ